MLGKIAILLFLFPSCLGLISHEKKPVKDRSFIPVCLCSYDGCSCGYVDEDGNVVIPFHYAKVTKFSQGLSAVRRPGSAKLYGYIDLYNRMVIQPGYVDAGEFDESGVAIVHAIDERHKHVTKIIDRYGNVKIEKVNPGADRFYRNLLPVNQNGRCGYIDIQGEFVVSPDFDACGSFMYADLAWVKFNGKYGFINVRGEMVIPPMFDSAGDFAQNGLACVEKNGLKGFIGVLGDEIIPLSFSDCTRFGQNGLAAVQHDGLWGYIDVGGNYVINPTFEEARAFAVNGLAAVRINGKYGFIDATGSLAIKPEYAEVVDFGELTPPTVTLVRLSDEIAFRYIDAHGKAFVSQSQKCGKPVLLNRYGKVVWPTASDSSFCE